MLTSLSTSDESATNLEGIVQPPFTALEFPGGERISENSVHAKVAEFASLSNNCLGARFHTRLDTRYTPFSSSMPRAAPKPVSVMNSCQNLASERPMPFP